MPLIRNVLKPLAKSLLIPLGVTAAASVTDAVIHKKMFGSSTTTLIISNEEMNDIMKIVKSLYKSKGISQTTKIEAKEQKRGFLSMLLGILGASLLRNLLTGKEEIAVNQGQGKIKAGEGTIRAGQGIYCHLIL